MAKAPLKFNEGGEHESLGVPAGKPISAKLHAKAASGAEGKLAKKQELFKRNVLTGPKKAATGAVVKKMGRSDGRTAPEGKSGDKIKSGLAKMGY